MAESTERECIERIRDKAIKRARQMGTVILDEIPEGWRNLHASTQPNGTFWAGHGSRFDGTYEHVLVWMDWMKDAMRKYEVKNG